MCYSQYGWYRFLFWRGLSIEQPELLKKLLSVLGAPLITVCNEMIFFVIKVGIGNGNGHRT